MRELSCLVTLTVAKRPIVGRRRVKIILRSSVKNVIVLTDVKICLEK